MGCPKIPVTPFFACFGRTWDRSSLPRMALSALCAVAEAEQLASSPGILTKTRSSSLHDICKVLVGAAIWDFLPGRATAFLAVRGEGAHRDTRTPLLAVSFLWRIRRCGPEARDACFSQLDAMMRALAALPPSEDPRLRACLCRLIHDLIFVDGSEERMVFRLQQESSPR